jgi:hypothetical protein
MIVRTWTDWGPIRKPFGTSGLKEGAVGVLGEWTPREKRGKDETSERKNWRYACRLFGTNSLKEREMWRIYSMQELLSHRSSHC